MSRSRINILDDREIATGLERPLYRATFMRGVGYSKFFAGTSHNP